ncbi:MAG: penicillin-binding protein 2, partial [Bilophila sp.]
DISATLAQVSSWVDIPLDQLTARFQQDRRKVKPFEPILLLTDMPFEQVARIESQLMHWPGLEIVTRSKRHYPEGEKFAHILGYVAEANEQELAADSYLSLGDTVGKQGIEYVFEPRLRGRKGLYSVEVDVLGRSLGKTLDEEPQNGENIQLCLDAKLQKSLADLLGDQTGSIVIMEPHTGRLRALVTTPSYDNNLFVGGLSQKTWTSLRDDPFHPLQNRAIQSVYPPGSVWKLMMVGLFMQEGISPSARVSCSGAVTLGNRVFRCWRKIGHGSVDMLQSLMQSCDVYYYTLGEKVGIDKIEAFARACGFGGPTGIDLPHEKSGLVPSRTWKRRRSGEAWYRGETLNVSIGQGYTLITPLQLADFVSSLLNGGKLMKPLLLMDEAPEVRSQIPIPEQGRKLILEGMRLTADQGTGRVLKRTDAIIGGKTGTAQVVKVRMVGERRQRKEEMAYLERDHAWIASWGQKDGEDIVVVVMLEHGGGGSSAAGPVARKVYDILYNTVQPPPVGVVEGD